MMNLFGREFLKSLYASDAEARVSHVERLIRSASEFGKTLLDGYPKSADKVKGPLQFHKDEPSITLFTFAALLKCNPIVWRQLLENCFPDTDWTSIDTDDIVVELEKSISPTPAILAGLAGSAGSHPVKYVRECARDKTVVEGATDFDAVITIQKSIKIFVECKFTSDISVDTTYNTTRNQIARCIDIGLASLDDRMEEFYFILLTPRIYQEDPGSRFYYFKMNQYIDDPQALALDIPRFEKWFDDETELNKISRKLSFLTWEKCVDQILENGSWTTEEKDQLIQFYSDRNLYFDTSDLPMP